MLECARESKSDSRSHSSSLPCAQTAGTTDFQRDGAVPISRKNLSTWDEQPGPVPLFQTCDTSD